MCTDLPAITFKYTGRVAARVLPSPVFISAILPSCKTIPPISWTSKCLIFNVLFEASLTTANASGSMSSIVFCFSSN